MKKSLIIISAAFAVIPGIGALWKGFLAPPGLESLFCFYLEIFGIGTLGILLVSKKARKIVKKVPLALFLIGVFGLLAAYLWFFSICVISPSDWKGHADVYFPVKLYGEAESLVDLAGGRVAALNEYGPKSMIEKLNGMPHADSARSLTTLLLITLYVIFVCALTAFFAIIGLSKREDTSAVKVKKKEK